MTSLQDSLQEAAFQTHDGLNLWARHWRARPVRGEAKPCSVAIVHGVGEHSGRYGNLVEHLTHAGFDVHGFDLRGHGCSEGRPVHVEQWEDYLRDVTRYLSEVARVNHGNPLILYGHSLGSLIVLDFLIQTLAMAPRSSSVTSATASSPLIPHPSAQPASPRSPAQITPFDSAMIHGAILSGVPLQPVAVAKPHLVWAAQILSRIWPNCRLPLHIDPGALSRDPAVVKAYREDPLVQSKATARWGREALMAWKRVQQDLGKVSCPVLILHGELDRISRAEGSRQLFAQVKSRDKRLRIYPDGAHEPHNDLGSSQVLADVQEWLSEQVRDRGQCRVAVTWKRGMEGPLL